MSVRLVIVDDHPVVRKGLRAVLDDEDDLDVVDAVATSVDAVAAAQRLRPDVMLLDLDLDGSDAVAVIPQLVAAGARIVVFTAYGSNERVLSAVRAGAHGYVLKGAPVGEIAAAIRRVHGGGSYLDPRVTAGVLEQVRTPSAAVLSERQSQVLRLVAQGLSNQQIADRLHLTERTVKFHVNAVFNKLGADNRAQAVALAAQRGLLE